MKKARKAKLAVTEDERASAISRDELGRRLFHLTALAQGRGWSAEELLRAETAKQEKAFRRAERTKK